MIVEEVKTRQFGERDAFIEHGVRLATEYLNVMAEIDQSFCEMAGVDTLAANMRFSSIGEVGDPKGTVWIETPRHLGKAIGECYQRVIEAKTCGPRF